jgi:general secretion pathway protein D
MKTLMTRALAVMMAISLLTSCAGYNAWQKARAAEQKKDWDRAVAEYEAALHIDPDNTRFKIAADRARRLASREHFEKGKSLVAAAQKTNGPEQLRLMQLAGTELELTVKLDPTNQFAAVELGKVVMYLNEAIRAQNGETIEEMKKRAKAASVTKAQPPQLNPASDEPISLSFPQQTPVKDIYRALGNAFGINILFDQAVKDDQISIELRDVTAQQALERVMQAANHFYKVLDEKTIIVVPDNPQARRDYEDLVIRTFYLSNGDAEQVTNVVRTMIEARNVFPLKALNAITIRDTADKVRIAEKIIEANDKAKAEVVVAVELVQLDLSKLRDIGMSIQGPADAAPGAIVPNVVGADGKNVPLTGGTAVTLSQFRSLGANSFTFSMPSVTYTLTKSMTNSELLANPELRISEGEKATLHIGNRIPVPVSTFTAISTGTSPYQPVVSYQYQDVGIKVSMEPRVHHNREVTLKLTVEVSNQGPNAPTVPGQAPQPTFQTRTIESTIRLKDGETNFLAGLIQSNKSEGDTKTPFLGDLPIIGRLFRQDHRREDRTDLVLTMTPHIMRIPDITEDDLAPMWVGTTNNLTFRGVTPRIESQSAIDPFTTPVVPAPQRMPATVQAPAQGSPATPGFVPPSGSAPTDPFRQNPPVQPPPPPQPQSQLQQSQSLALANLAPRIAPQPAALTFKPGEQKVWTVVGMDLEGLTTDNLTFRYDPSRLDVQEIRLGPALAIDPKTPPVVTLDREHGLLKIAPSNGSPLAFNGGGELLQLRVQGGLAGETALVVDQPRLKNGDGEIVAAAISGGRVNVE